MQAGEYGKRNRIISHKYIVIVFWNKLLCHSYPNDK